MKRLVAAYAIGNSLPQALVDDSYEDIEVCSTPTQTGCFITWDAHEADKHPSHWSNQEEQDIWNGIDYSGFDPGPRICVNPVTWRTDGTRSDKGDHLGALTLEAGYSDLTPHWANWLATQFQHIAATNPLENGYSSTVIATRN